MVGSEICSVLEKNWKKIYSKTLTKSVQLLQPEHGFCQQNARQNVAKYWYPSEKMVVFPAICFKVDFVLQCAWVLYRIKKGERDESLPVLAFRRHIVNAIFLKYSKEGRLSSNHLGIRNIPSDACYGDTKHYQVQSERRRIQNPFKHLRESVFT